MSLIIRAITISILNGIKYTGRQLCCGYPPYTRAIASRKIHCIYALYPFKIPPRIFFAAEMKRMRHTQFCTTRGIIASMYILCDTYNKPSK